MPLMKWNRVFAKGPTGVAGGGPGGGAGEVVEDEKSALEADLGVVPRALRIAQDDVVAGVAADGERPVRLQPITLFRAVKSDKENLRHRGGFYATGRSIC